MKKADKSSSAGTEVESSTNADSSQVCQPIAKPNVVGSCFSSGDWYVGKLFPLPDIYCDGKKVANISKELPIEEREANARLISASPDLLNSLTGKEELPQLYSIGWLGTMLRMCKNKDVYESLCKEAKGDFDAVNIMLNELKQLEESGTKAVKKAFGLS